MDKVIKKYLDYKFSSSNQSHLKDKSDVDYFKLPYIGNLSHHIKNKLLKLCKEFCKENFNIKRVFNSFKIKNYFAYKGPSPNDLKSLLVYKHACASCSSSYFCKTCCDFKTRIEEHIKKDNKSHIFKHLHSSETCFDSYNSVCFKIIDKADSKFDLKIKEALHINWRKLKCATKSFSSHPFTIASVPLVPFCICLFFFFCILHFSFIYCFHYLYTNYWYLLLS